jgi:glucose/arabinose dehydrogenase
LLLSCDNSICDPRGNRPVKGTRIATSKTWSAIMRFDILPAVARVLVFLACSLMLLSGRPATADIKTKMLLSTIKLPPGFTIELFASGVPDARSMALSPDGVLFVGTRKAGAVYAVVDDDQDYEADRVITIAKGLNMPNGVALWDDDLYVAEVNRILRFAQIEANLEKPPTGLAVYRDFPRERSHGWKFIRFGPDGNLYVPVGAPCNVCRNNNPVFASITRINRQGGDFEIFAHGVRNTVGFDWHPQTGELWFTDNGRDFLGDDQPPDELNRAPMPGLHFGFPYCHGGTIADPQYGADQSCEQFTAPAMALGPHVAALGMRFYTGRTFPEPYHNQIFIAEHGSWNRTDKIGYQVSLVRLKGNQAVAYEPFATGWLLGDTAWGRPVDVEIMPDGSMLVSDDKNGAIYRIAYNAAP